jgi:polynucleotide 5'-hydroxyl-kinase GRC3/NOL9
MEVSVSQTTNTQLQISSIRGSPSFRLTNPIRPTIIPPSWRASVDQIGRDVTATPPPVRESLEENAPFVRSQDSIIMISGAKSVGKSTLMRYMTNRLLQLSAISAVAIVDADIGQPELAPPGMLTLSLRLRPLLHPPYWNLCDDTNKSEHTIQSIYFGAVTSKVDPTRYLESIQRLIQAYRDYMAQTTDRIPLIINLDGWIKGMGFQILSCLIDTTRPSHMCQIVGDSKAKTFDLSEVISSDDVDGAVQTQLFYLDVCNKFVSPFTIPSSSLRTLRLCAYFGPHLVDLWDSLDFLPAKQLQTGWSGDDECRLAQYLAQERPYCVPFEAVECVHSNTGVHMDLIHSLAKQHAPATLIFQVLNGSIVGLCIEGQEDCLGLGIVRSIDWDRRLLFVLTPVSCDQLFRVKVLVGGNIPLPPPMVFRGVYAESFPYMSTTTATTTASSSGGGTTMNGSRDEGNMTQSYKILGSEPMKSRNNISRRSFAGTK